MRVGLIGAMGWIGASLGAGMLDSGVVAAADLTVLTRRDPPGAYLGNEAVHWARSVEELVERSDVVIVSVRPQDWPALHLRAPGRLVISVMAMVPMRELAASGGRVVRAMPNALAEQRRSYSPWFAAPDVIATDKAAVTRILDSIGRSDELQDEDHLDVMTVLPGSGPAYPALVAAAMLDFARARGLPEPIARRAVEAVICDGAALLQGRIETAPEVIAAFRDYAGVTAAGLNGADDAGLSTALRAGLDAALRACRPTD
ncbi:NAD(P)-binding domain-containing protein [Sinirhodobacter sp. WL0062]|uniref:NAD(P)-binding domain-containing protein n=1 Tax=Rhodobacter flavimaris TaxID=2907145 RepID=A0ABS8YRI4_9RHOB|nr:pyrroline-5-carboxylate reductase dimerization domain-containing protein [Sinirhodobacter sp. WL0062]MCE5972492.1 NAD(P)-binding domain-containing protein [Sinirhodobacter sp. WL0062]